MKRASSVPDNSPPATASAGALPPLLGNLRTLAVATSVFLLATLAAFGDLLFDGGDRILSLTHTDTYSVFVGWYEFTFGEMARGNLPLWNPHLFSGAPCLGGFQEALLYPPSWLHLILPLPQAINWGIALHVFLAGIFTYLWTARRGLHPAAAVISGLVFMFGGSYFMHITAGHIPNLQTMAWAPLIFLAIDDITATTSLRGAWLGSLAVMMQILAGHPQYVYYTALIAGPYALCSLWRAPSRPRAVLGLALMGIGGVALSAVQLFTGLAAAGESLRSKLPIDVAGTFPFPPENLLTLALPGFFGKVSTGLYWGRWLIWEDSIFIGAVALILAIYGASRGERKLTPITITLFMLLSLLLALGSTISPLYQLLYHYLPGFSSFRGVSKMIFLTALFLAYLAGVGFDRILRAPRISRITPAIILAAAAIVLVIGVMVRISGNAGSDGTWGRMLSRIDWSAGAYQHASMTRTPRDADFFRTTAHGAAADLFWCAATCAAVAGLWLAAGYRRRAAYGIALLLCVELLAFAWQNRPWFHREEIAAQERTMGDFLDQARQMEMRYRMKKGDADATPPDLRVISNDPSVVLGAGGNEGWGNDPMVLRRYAEFMARKQDPPAGQLPIPSSLWTMMRIRFVQSPADRKWNPLGGQLLKRGELIEDVRVVNSPADMFASLSDGKFDFHHTVLLENPVTPTPVFSPGNTEPPGVVEVKDIAGETDEIEVAATVKRACILVISDNYSSGWQAVPLPDAPGHTYEVIPADYTLRGIPLSPGSHHFILQYRPTAYVIGKWVTVMSLVAWLGAGVALGGWVKRKRVEAGPGMSKHQRKGKKK